MQMKTTYRKIITENPDTSSMQLVMDLSGVLGDMARRLPEDSRVHELTVKKLDGNTIDTCDCPKAEGRYSSLSPEGHRKNCRKGEPNHNRRFLVVASVSSGDEQDMGEDGANEGPMRSTGHE